MAIKAKLATLGTIMHIAVWNDQVALIQQQKGASHDYPAVFIEMVNDNPPHSVGNGVQLYEPLDIKLHIVYEQLDSQLGTLDENLDVFDFKDTVYKLMQKFEPDGASSFNRVAETQDYTHTNVYHFIQTFRTTWIDRTTNFPVDGVDIAGIQNAYIELSIDPTNDPDDPYTIPIKVTP